MSILEGIIIYTIKNSFDTHFIINSIEALNSAVVKSRMRLEQEIVSIKKEFANADESFNPFIEVGQEEEKF